MSKSIQIDITTRRARADHGHGSDPTGQGMIYRRSVLVDRDGRVSAWDELAESYSIAHDLAPEDVAEAQRLASLVRAGTHYVAGGVVFSKR